MLSYRDKDKREKCTLKISLVKQMLSVVLLSLQDVNDTATRLKFSSVQLYCMCVLLYMSKTSVFNYRNT